METGLDLYGIFESLIFDLGCLYDVFLSPSF